MKALRLSAALVIVTNLTVVLSMYASEAEACVPPMYEMYHADVVEEDTPECVKIHDFPRHHYDGEPLQVGITNDCAEDLELHIIDCPTDGDAETAQSEDFTCGDLVVGPGATEWLEVEQRPSYDLSHGEHHEQVYSWHVGAEEGIVHTEYTFEDPYVEDGFADEQSYEGGCAMMDEGPLAMGCSTAGASLPVDVLILLGIAVGVMTIRRHWSSPRSALRASLFPK